jgi:hypothetical protein
VARFRVEVQVKVADWIIRPMEVRVVQARVPDLPAGPDRTLPAIEAAASAAPFDEFTRWYAGVPLTMPPPGDTLRGILRRDGIQDLALAGDPGVWAPRVVDLFRANVALRPPAWGAEWWLRLRDALLR